MLTPNYQDLENNCTAIDKHENNYGIPWDLTEKLTYFTPSPSNIKIPISLEENPWELYKIPLNPKLYGFSSTRLSYLHQNSQVIGFAPPAQASIDKLFHENNHPLNEILETITSAVNRSVEYDLESIKKSPKLTNFTKNVLQDSDYFPEGDETVKGVCTEAGYLIRTLLSRMVNDPELRYMELLTYSKKTLCHHDTTLVFDINSGEWVVLNSKSPLKQYNLVPKEKLKDLGKPF